MMLRDEIDKAVAHMTPEELNKLLQSLILYSIPRDPNDTDEQWRKRILDYHFNHEVESKRKKAIERICQAVGVKTPEEHATEFFERRLNCLQPTARQRLLKDWIKPIVVGVIVVILGYALNRIFAGQ